MPWDEGFFDETQNQRFVELRVTQTCFLIGFPLGLVDRTTPVHVLPIYKTAHIASEPHLDFQGRPIVIIDGTTRRGMSGSPVVVSRENYGSHPNHLVGIYTGPIAGRTSLSGFPPPRPPPERLPPPTPPPARQRP